MGTLTKCGFVGRCQCHPSGYKHKATFGYREPSKAHIASVALAELEQARRQDIQAHAANEPILAKNREVQDRVRSLMKEIGMPDHYIATDPNSRARIPKKIRHMAGYFGDLHREFPVDDGFDAATATYLKLKECYDQYAADGKAEQAASIAAREKAEADAKAARLANVELAEIILRYGLNREADWDEVLEALRGRDQRLDLAVAMQQTRNDWSDGAGRVSDAIRGFKIECDEDKEIVTEMLSILENFEDGRSFRDCDWNYSRLFQEAKDQQLSRDIIKAMSHTEED